MSDTRFIGLVHSLLSAAQAALGESDSPMTTRLLRDDLLARKTAVRSLALLDMLHDKTLGNLDETERAALREARSDIRERMQKADDTEGASGRESDGTEGSSGRETDGAEGQSGRNTDGAEDSSGRKTEGADRQNPGEAER